MHYDNTIFEASQTYSGCTACVPATVPPTNQHWHGMAKQCQFGSKEAKPMTGTDLSDCAGWPKQLVECRQHSPRPAAMGIMIDEPNQWHRPPAMRSCTVHTIYGWSVSTSIWPGLAWALLPWIVSGIKHHNLLRSRASERRQAHTTLRCGLQHTLCTPCAPYTCTHVCDLPHVPPAARSTQSKASLHLQNHGSNLLQADANWFQANTPVSHWHSTLHSHFEVKQHTSHAASITSASA
jgi:hypothetical protein